MTLQNEFTTHFQASPLILMRVELLVSSQSCRGDVDAWCKRALTESFGVNIINFGANRSLTGWKEMKRFY